MNINDRTEEFQKEIDDFLEQKRDKPFSFNFYSDWGSFLFWRPMNWRDFTFIHFSLETADHKIIEISLTILGLHFNFDWWKTK